MIKISAIVITYNEEKNIVRCLDSLLRVADEILVIDSFSKDGTKKKCEEKGVRFIENAFEGYIEQKNFGIDLAAHDFILSIDADEYLSDKLIQSILDVKQNGKHEAYSMNRLSSYGNKWIRHTDWYPDKKLRLWNRKFGRWGGPNPHEKIILKKIDVKHLAGDLLHVAYKDSDQLLLKANLYSSLFAQNARIRIGSSYFKVIYKTIYTFIRNYFIKTGFYSGLAGLQISFTNATYTFFKFSKLLELSRSLPVFHEEGHTYKPNGISVVIPNHNGAKLFPRTIDPLLSVLHNIQIPFEIFIVDDCSTDDSVKYLMQHHPEIKILRNEVNRGFSCTVNKGIYAAQYDLVLLLNSDIILTEGYFQHQLKYFRRKDTFGVMGKIIGWNDEIIQDGAKVPESHGLKVKTSGNYLLDKMDEESLYTLYLSGANALVDRKKLIALGGFDEIFSPFYIEDCDLSFRAWRLGWKCYYENRAVCRHQTSFSVKANRKKNYVDVIYNRNKLFLHAIHLKSFQLPVWFLQVLLDALARLLTLRVSLIKAIILFIRQRNDWMTSRKRFQDLMAKQGESISLFRIFRGIRQSLYKRRKIKFLSKKEQNN